MAKKKRKSGKKKHKGPTTKGGFPLFLFKQRFAKMKRIAADNGIS